MYTKIKKQIGGNKLVHTQKFFGQLMQYLSMLAFETPCSFTQIYKEKTSLVNESALITVS